MKSERARRGTSVLVVLLIMVTTDEWAEMYRMEPIGWSRKTDDRTTIEIEPYLGWALKHSRQSQGALGRAPGKSGQNMDTIRLVQPGAP